MKRLSQDKFSKKEHLWSPGRLEMSDVGMMLYLSTTSITKDNVEVPGLWGNQ